MSESGSREFDLGPAADRQRIQNQSQFRTVLFGGAILVAGWTWAIFALPGLRPDWGNLGEVATAFALDAALWVLIAFVIWRSYRTITATPRRLRVTNDWIAFESDKGPVTRLYPSPPGTRLWLWDMGEYRSMGFVQPEDWIRYNVRIEKGPWMGLSQEAFQALITELPRRGYAAIPHPSGFSVPDVGEVTVLLAPSGSS